MKFITFALILQFLTGSNQLKPDQTSLNQFKPDQTGSNWLKPDQTGSNQIKLVKNQKKTVKTG